MENKVNENSSSVKNKSIIKDIIIWFVYAFLCFLDAYLAIVFYLFISAKQNRLINNVEKISDKKQRIIEIVILSINVILAYAAIIMFYYGNWEHGIWICQYKLFSSWELVLLQIIPVIWMLKNKKAIKGCTGVKTFIFIIIPILINSIFICLERSNRFFGYEKIIQEILYAVFTAAILEEVFFRGYVYRSLKKLTGKVLLSQVISSLLFTFWHIGLVGTVLSYFYLNDILNLVTIFFVGMASCQIYEKTNSLSMSIAFHAINNGLVSNIIELIKALSI